MTEENLNITEEVVIDEAVASYQYVERDTDQGNGSLNNQTELTITYQQEDGIFLPSESYLRIEGTLLTAADANIPNNSAIAFVNNGLMYLFSNAKYFLGTQNIEYFENVGLTTTMHNYLTKSRSYQGDNWFWIPDTLTPEANVNNIPWRTRNLLVNPQANNGVWNFSATIPLSSIFNFCNDYRKGISGLQHRISLTRTNSTRALYRTNAAVAATGVFPALVALAADAKVNITTLKWCMPSLIPSEAKKAELLSITMNKVPIPLTFLNKRCETIAVPQATTFNWNLQMQGGIERPRFLIFGFQTGRGGDQLSNNASFDSTGLNVISAYVVLNNVRYPYTDMGTDYATNKYTKWYSNYLKFFNKYNSDNIGEACLSYLDFIKIAPLYVFDVSNQPTPEQPYTVSASLNMTFAAAAPANTIAYCLEYFDSKYILTRDSITPVIQILNTDGKKI